MDALTTHTIDLKGQRTHYYEGGSLNGRSLIFVHGWPDTAEVWKRQIAHFRSSEQYRVIALDMRGYGKSSSPSDKLAYSLEVLVLELVEFLEKLKIKKAIWIGHDWGCAVVSALAAHHPEICDGIALLAVPYRSLELGVNHLISMVNRDIYPEGEFPYGQFSYMKYYEAKPESSVREFEAVIEKVLKLLYVKHDPRQHGKPGRTSRTMQEGGRFGDNPELVPDIPLSTTLLDEDAYNNLVQSHKTHGFFGPIAYYLNHDSNAEYAKSEKNGGFLDMQVLHIDARHDAVCSYTTTPQFGVNQKNFCTNLTEKCIEGGHWIMLECSDDVNKALEEWLEDNFHSS